MYIHSSLVRLLEFQFCCTSSCNNANDLVGFEFSSFCHPTALSIFRWFLLFCTFPHFAAKPSVEEIDFLLAGTQFFHYRSFSILWCLQTHRWQSNSKQKKTEIRISMEFVANGLHELQREKNNNSVDTRCAYFSLIDLVDPSNNSSTSVSRETNAGVSCSTYVFSLWSSGNRLNEK